MTSVADWLCFQLTGQDLLVVKHQLAAITSNLTSWLLVRLRVRRPQLALAPAGETSAVQILSPGGFERFARASLVGGLATVGYNVREGVERVPGSASIVRTDWGIPPTCAVVRVSHFSVNYADVTIRWGLYESAIRYVGYPIVPGFDFAGVVEQAGAESGVSPGERVFGITFFGAYSDRLLVPGQQLRPVPPPLSAAEAAAFPSVAGTALHSMALAGFWPSPPLTRNRACLIHSAAGGVGSMLVQLAKILGCSPIVAVVGSGHKVAVCRALGADVVIDKSSQPLWDTARAAAPDGFAAIFDANGVATLAQSYAHLARTGKLVVYGFTTNLPSGAMLNPLAWARMARDVVRLPRFDPMDLVLASKSVHGFNLSFFADETELVDVYMDQLVRWVGEGRLTVAKVTEFDASAVPRAHQLIQSGKSVGKIVCRTKEQQG